MDQKDKNEKFEELIKKKLLITLKQKSYARRIITDSHLKKRQITYTGL